MSKNKQDKEIEKVLEAKYGALNYNNVITLKDDDFEADAISLPGYTTLKEQIKLIPNNSDVVVKIPTNKEITYMNSIEPAIAQELFQIKKKRKTIMISSIILLIVGVIFLVLSTIFEALKILITQNVLIIASWVFIWIGVERWFFDRFDLRTTRKNLLRIIQAKVETY